ncbi:MAG: tRNA (guanosine(46)-N7)-methyltransferase TrmB [Verrucomicrobiae bacterium]|nr:tRNA (guanosine(46)-N7)-methyltransferase TrmB [Verrucomicrobiae bacterium]NNJ44096.1 tRNA (guanosine(46)-N7)-methyltransferase TrmB [Akkermansiaceae bacterium]
MPACARTPEPCEFMPDDFFRRHSPDDIFPHNHPLEIDLGCGDGTFLIEMAQHYPERNFLGVERLLGRVRGVCKRIQALGLTNAKVLRLESQYTLEWLLAKHSVSRLHLLCPDPWPKARHHKRRLVQQEFLTILENVLTPDGEFLFKTDHPEYFEWVCEEMDTFAQSGGKFSQLPWPADGEQDALFYPKTDFQRHWESQGKTIHRLRYQR